MLDKLNSTQRKLVLSIIALIIYIGSSAASYSFFHNSTIGGDLTTSLPSPSSEMEEDPGEPRTEKCPLDGEMHTKKAKDAWEKRRPLAVMIENSVEARPQSGLTSADVVYEAIAEGGITRFMALFYCELPETQVGPVRSARTYFLDWISEYDGLYAHVGGANTPGPANALGQIADYKIKALNQFGIGFPTFWRDYERLGRPVATEHTMYSTTYKLWEVAEKRGLGAKDASGVAWDAKFVPWKFADSSSATKSAPKVHVEFWTGYKDFFVDWQYDATSKRYLRVNGGQNHMDLNNNKQLSPANVVVQFMTEGRANDGYENNLHMIYGTKGTGEALIFQEGKAIEGTWSKANRLARTIYKDASGKEITFVPGQIWIQTVSTDTNITY